MVFLLFLFPSPTHAHPSPFALFLRRDGKWRPCCAKGAGRPCSSARQVKPGKKGAGGWGGDRDGQGPGRGGRPRASLRSVPRGLWRGARRGTPLPSSSVGVRETNERSHVLAPPHRGAPLPHGPASRAVGRGGACVRSRALPAPPFPSRWGRGGVAPLTVAMERPRYASPLPPLPLCGGGSARAVLRRSLPLGPARVWGAPISIARGWGGCGRRGGSSPLAAAWGKERKNPVSLLSGEGEELTCPPPSKETCPGPVAGRFSFFSSN